MSAARKKPAARKQAAKPKAPARAKAPARSKPPAKPLLEARGVTKRFGGVVALNGLDITVGEGEIVGLIGPNGSGKTTFFNVVTSIYNADGGNIVFGGEDVTACDPPAIYRAGIARTFQRSRLSLPLSIFDNIMIGNHARLSQGLWFNLMNRSGFKREFEENFERARDLVKVFDPPLADRMFDAVAGLPMIDRRRIEICRGLISEPRLLMLDEPSAGMTHDETVQLMGDLMEVRGEMENLSIVIV